MDAATRTSLGHTLFGLATLVTLLSALDAFLNAKTRWRQLRSSSGALEAVLWLYRARVGRFQQSISETARPETELCEAINMWRDELVSAADLQTTDLERLRPPKIYLHHQHAGTVKPGSDDHHSPIKPDQYIALRLDKMMRFSSPTPKPKPNPNPNPNHNPNQVLPAPAAYLHAPALRAAHDCAALHRLLSGALISRPRQLGDRRHLARRRRRELVGVLGDRAKNRAVHPRRALGQEGPLLVGRAHRCREGGCG